jgi:hypothetical protein
LCLIVLRDHNAPRNINAMNLKDELGQIEANSHDFKQMARLFIVPDAARAPSIPSREPWWNRPARQYACQFPLRNPDADLLTKASRVLRRELVVAYCQARSTIRVIAKHAFLH